MEFTRLGGGEQGGDQQTREEAAGRAVGFGEPARLGADVHRAKRAATKADRHVHDRADAEAEDQLVIGESLLHLVRCVGDEDFATVETCSSQGVPCFGLRPLTG
jgi:hypothetical protein